MSEFQPTGRNPIDFEEVTVNAATVKTLTKKGVNYAICQFQELTVGSYTDSSRICRYKRNGETPTNASGFLAGDTDTAIFTQGELAAGVKLLSAETGKSFFAVIQYY